MAITIHVNRIVLEETQAMAHCGATVGRRYLCFEVPIPFAVIPGGIEQTIRDFIAAYPDKQKYINADVWEGFEFEL